MKKTNIKYSFRQNFLEGTIAYLLWEGVLYIFDYDLGLVAKVFLLVITYLIASNIIRKYFIK